MKNKKIFIIIFFAVLILAIAAILFYFKPFGLITEQLVKPSAEQNFNVIILGWDGTQWDRFQECYNKKIPDCPQGLPNIKEFTESSEGKIFLNVVGNGTTWTVAGWPQVLSGYNSGFTGIIDNRTYKALPRGASILEKLKKYLGKNNIITAFMGMEGTISSSCPGEKKDARKEYLGEPEYEVQGGPWCNLKRDVDFFANDLVGDKGVGEKMLELISQYQDKRFIMFGLFSDADDNGHKYGVFSPEYAQGLIDYDAWLGKVTARLKELGIYDRTYVYVISDHGWDRDVVYKGSVRVHFNAPFSIFASNDPTIIRPGDRRDLAPTILKKFGAPLGPDGDLPALHGYPLDALPSISYVPEGEAYINYPGAPKCAPGTALIGLDQFSIFLQLNKCVAPQGGADIIAGYCVKYGNGICEPPENQCNAPEDCR